MSRLFGLSGDLKEGTFSLINLVEDCINVCTRAQKCTLTVSVTGPGAIPGVFAACKQAELSPVRFTRQVSIRNNSGKARMCSFCVC